ncbi:hypothetical protein BGY98DRAFT_1104267 [Russula aff. rugulosa BPL654]|nr:hypothetical protein BGY98DRAFT_1104267 [Russula aff. rugulosa BPL654]
MSLPVPTAVNVPVMSADAGPDPTTRQALGQRAPSSVVLAALSRFLPVPQLFQLAQQGAASLASSMLCALRVIAAPTSFSYQDTAARRRGISAGTDNTFSSTSISTIWRIGTHLEAVPVPAARQRTYRQLTDAFAPVVLSSKRIFKTRGPVQDMGKAVLTGQDAWHYSYQSEHPGTRAMLRSNMRDGAGDGQIPCGQLEFASPPSPAHAAPCPHHSPCPHCPHTSHSPLPIIPIISTPSGHSASADVFTFPILSLFDS